MSAFDRQQREVLHLELRRGNVTWIAEQEGSSFTVRCEPPNDLVLESQDVLGMLLFWAFDEGKKAGRAERGR